MTTYCATPQLSPASFVNKNNSNTIQYTDNPFASTIETRSIQPEEEKTDVMVARPRELSMTYSKTLNDDNAEPQPILPTSEQDEGFIGELMLKDDSDEHKRPVAFSKKLKRLSLTGKNKVVKPTTASDDDDDDDDDNRSLMSPASNSSLSRGRSSRRSLSKALENGSANIRNLRSKSPSLLRRLRRRNSADSCSTLMQQLHDDDDHHDGEQPKQIVLTDTNLVYSSNHHQVEDDLSDDEETCYSQFQPSLNHSLLAEGSIFVKDKEHQSYGAILLSPSENSRDPMIVVITNNQGGFVGSDDSLDTSVPSLTAEMTERSFTESIEHTPSPKEPTKPPGKAASSRSPRRERASLMNKRRNKMRHSVSPKRNSSLSKNGNRPKRHSTNIPTRHSSVPSVVAKRGGGVEEEDGDNKRSSLNKTTSSRSKREKTTKKDRTSTSSGKREKTYKRREKHNKTKERKHAEAPPAERVE